MYTRNNIKKISYLPVVLWKIEKIPNWNKSFFF
jgi:hypothetical protein